MIRKSRNTKVSKPRKTYSPDTIAQVALNQVDHATKLSHLGSGLTQLSMNIGDIITQFNKVNLEMSTRIQTLESRCAELDRLICSPKSSSNDKSDVLN
jgi:hypothetical protein